MTREELQPYLPKRLGKNMKTVCVLHFVEGYEVPRVAEVMEIAPQGAYRIVKQVRELVEKDGYKPFIQYRKEA